MADNQTKEKIVLCKMFTGNYWENENNLGHETINMFLPDNSQNGESYIYLPASGDYDLTQHEIKKVLLVRSIPGEGRNIVQIIGKADVTCELLKGKIETCLSGGKEFVGLCHIFDIFNPEFNPNSKDAWKEIIEKKDVTDEKIEQLTRAYKMDVSTSQQNYYALAVRLGLANKVNRSMGATDLIRLINEKEDSCWLSKYYTERENKNGQKSYQLTEEGEKYIRDTLKTNDLDANASQKEYNYWYAISKKWKTRRGGKKDKDTFIQDIVNQYNKKVSKLRKVFESQGEEGNIRQSEYAGIRYDEIFENNENFGLLNICATLKVEKMQLVKKGKSLYLTTEDPAQFNDLENKKYISVKGSTLETDTFDENKETQNQPNKIGALSSTSQKVYLPYDDKGKNLWDNLTNNYADFFGPAEPLQIKEEEIPYLQDSFLTVTKHEYDELAYSNLFAYFFRKSPAFVSYFFKNVKDKDDNVLIENGIGASKGISAETVEISDDDWDKIEGDKKVKREERNIDIVLNAGERVVVIENKIKSALNGSEIELKDKVTVDGQEKTIKCKDQLIRYYTYIEEKYPTKDTEHHKYFIFAPDYNHIEQEEFGWIESLQNNMVKMKDKWRIVRYSAIFNGIRNYDIENDTNLNNPFDKNLFNEFLKALNVHTDFSANNYYRQMQKRLVRIQAKKKKTD